MVLGIRNFVLYFNTRRSVESVLRHWTNKAVEEFWVERGGGGEDGVLFNRRCQFQAAYIVVCKGIKSQYEALEE
jgi:hypothetical protein